MNFFELKDYFYKINMRVLCWFLYCLFCNEILNLIIEIEKNIFEYLVESFFGEGNVLRN